MRTRLTRLMGAVAVVFAVGATGAGTAQAAEPVVVGSCSTSVQGAPGTPVALSPAAVVQPITDLIRAIPLLGPPLAEPFKTTFTALPPIPIGAIPTGTGVITGGEIADRVNAELAKIPLLGPVLTTLTDRVRTELTKLCGVTVTGVNKAAAPVQDGSKALADKTRGGLPGSQPGGQPGNDRPGTGEPGTGQPGTSQPGTSQPGTSQPGGQGGFTPIGGVGGLDLPLYGSNPFSGNFGRVPLFSYGSLPFAMPGQFSPSPGIRYGGNVPGYRPGYGLPAPDGVQTAGRAQSLPGGGKLGGGVAVPVLLAVLALSLVTGALVRTWVLRCV